MEASLCTFFPLYGSSFVRVFLCTLKNLSRIHNPLRIHRSLDRLHRGDCVCMLDAERGDLADADAVLAGAGAAEREGMRDERVGESLGFGELLGAIGIDAVHHVKVAVAHVTDERADEWRLVEIALGLNDRLGQ